MEKGRRKRVLVCRLEVIVINQMFKLKENSKRKREK
jgi:hypothetical protein